ncbi:MAG: chromosome segregation protein SMC [Candidatus Omnitrophica bacterium]|nr:chromosome segregation protein SMC [Candidatus Omnitrophota bacterium]
MFFKRLEIFGFKSFAEKTKLDFEAGVTAIVGPNGGGKSNLVDSIKWVLGEQSVRSMRGQRMEDVIFHGADDIPPVGFAEVALTVCNQNKLLPLDYEELTITRRIFRSGESEYLINKVPVRLKDIAELLMGTGLGMHSYSLMEQGKVDQILSSKPEERRAIFEEASGITKYKSRKEEALRKLERTKENLLRLGDIIVEVKRQMKSIERQVNKAQRYKQEFEKLKEYELEVSQYQYRNLKKEKAQLQDKSDELKKVEMSLSSKMDLASRTLEKTKQDSSGIEENISQTQAENYEVAARIKTTDNKTALDQERIEELAGRKESLEQQIQGLEKKITTTAEEIKEARAQIESVEQKKQAGLSFVREKEENINKILISVKEAQKEVSQDKMLEVEVIARQTKVKNDLTKLAANLANFNARLRRLNVESERTGQELSELGEKHTGCAGELELLEERLKQVTREIWNLKSNLDIKSEKKQKLDSHLEDISHQLTSHQSRLGFLKEITRKYEGFSGGVKSILSAMDSQALKIEGGCCVVADLVKVPPQYRLAIEMALGESAQGLVVENSQAADEAINYLKAEDKGRVSFVCLDSLSRNSKKDAKLQHSLGRALEFVKAESKYQKALEYLLADTFIVQDLETARRILKSTGLCVRLVTLDGEILTRTSIIGGSLPKDFDSGLLGRRERIARTGDELERIKKEKAGIESLKNLQDSEIKELSGQIQQKEPELNGLKIEKTSKESEKTNIETEKKRLQDEVSVLKLELSESSEQIEQLQGEEKDLNQQLLRLKLEQKKVQDSIQGHLELIAEKSQEKQNTLVEIAEAKAKALALDRETEDAKRRLQMILESEADQRQAQQAGATEVQDTAAKIEQLKQGIGQQKLESEGLSQSKVNLEEKLNKTLKRRLSLSVTIQDLEGRLRKDQKGLDKVREERANLQVGLTELNYKQGSLKDKMHQSYLVDLEAVLDKSPQSPPPAACVFDEIKRLKTRLEGMGPVNLVAIEENDQLQQRYSFLVSQQEDLVGAQESLRKAIAQINHTARKVFSETFQKIQVSFKEYFRILFGGGDARLVLIEENNILESGIEIVVRPPGKRLQNISLLSGGEKALTAIALLFSIFKVKPSPFCILDEVDAPLDEANIDRFTNLLCEFIKTSQFIIVTHNKKTINMADVMYGITMEKSGVSKIVSVRFAQEQGTAARELAQIEG